MHEAIRFSNWVQKTSQDLINHHMLREQSQPRTGKIRVICSKGMLSAVLLLRSGWLNSLLGSETSCPFPCPFVTTQPLFATWCSINLSKDTPSILVACYTTHFIKKKQGIYVFYTNKGKGHMKENNTSAITVLGTFWYVRERTLTAYLWIACSNPALKVFFFNLFQQI